MDVFALSCMNPEMVNVLIWQGGSHIGIGGSIFRNGWLSKCGLMALYHRNIQLMPDSKKLLVGILYLWVEDAKQKSPLRNRMFDTVSEYVNSLKDKKILLDYPLIDSGIVSEIKERVGK